ncbi:hypothetical protein [Streptomyces sp. NPDC046821]|uniref:hypothetical protein n=1 Tax=Streptomyces sp. NPDC046821 TaxID=3154702 RepID=UPI00340AAA26
MAWDEWQQSKDAVSERRTVRTQLNQAEPAGGGDLVVRQDDLGAVGHEAFILHGELRKRADIAGAGADKDGAGSTMRAAAALKSHHFALGSELATTVEMWTSQVKSVLQACGHISNHLDYSKKMHAHDDARIAADVRGRTGPLPVSALDGYFR